MIFITALAAATSASVNVVTPALAKANIKANILPLDSPTIAKLVAQGAAADPSQFLTLIKVFTSVANAAALFKALKLSETEFAFLVQNAAMFNWLDPSALPPSADPYPLFEALLRAVQLNRRQPVATSGLFNLLGSWLPPNSLPGTWQAAIASGLAVALNATVNDVTTIAVALNATGPALPPATQAGTLADIAMLSSIATALDFAARYRITAASLVQLATPVPILATAAAATAALQSQYPPSAWFGAVQPVEDTLRQSRRDALVAYLLGQGPAQPPAPANLIPLYLSTDDIFDYYLIDPWMSPSSLTTRLLQPSLAIQQFVQQCFLNLTFSGVAVDTTNLLWSEWSWRQQFRLWQANREVFLYPENYVLPETRTDASPFFADLQNNLLQSSVTTDSAQSAIETYLRSLVGVARLRVVALYNDLQWNNKSANYVLHVFARTIKTPWSWYYRKRTTFGLEAGSWTAWEPLNLDIDSQHVIPVLWDQRLFLFWATFKRITAQPQGTDLTIPSSTTAGGQAPVPKTIWTIELAFSELSAGKWQAKRIIEQKIYLSQDSTYDPVNFTFQVVPGNANSLNIYAFNQGDSIANATLLTPESILTVAEDTNSCAGKAYIDQTQEPSWALVDSTRKFSGSLLAPTGYIYGAAAQDLVHGMGTAQLAAGIPLNVYSRGTIGVTLLNSVTAPRIVVPQQESFFNTQDPFFLDDPTRTFLVQPHFFASSTSTQELTYSFNANYWTYSFHTFCHPFARTFLRELEVHGVPGLMARTLQLNPAETRGVASGIFTTYVPQPLVQSPYPGTTGAPDVFETALDFSPAGTGAYSLYNWETFYHIPMYVASLLIQNQQYQTP